MKKFESFFKRKKIIITGASGYIGSSLLKKFIDFNSEIFILSKNKEIKKFSSKNIKYKLIDFSDVEDYEDYLINSDYYFHLSYDNNIYIEEDKIKNQFRQNVFRLEKFFKKISDFKKKINFIYTSTSTVYGLPKKIPVDETFPSKILTSYDNTKYQTELLADQYKNNLNKCILRLPNIYGQGISNNQSRNILTKVIRKALSDSEIIIYGTGQYMRDYLHIDDLIRALLLSARHLNKLNENKFYNIGSGESITIKNCFKKIAFILEKKYNKKIKIKHINFENNANEIHKRNYFANYSKFNLVTKWKPKINFNRGINELVKEIAMENYEN